MLYTFVVGALGTWIPANSKPLAAVFLSGREKAIAIASVRSNIRWSARMWKAFCDGRDAHDLSEFRDPKHNPRDTLLLQEGAVLDEEDSVDEL